MDWMKLIHTSGPRADAASLRAGDDVRVWFRILEQGKERLGQFEGTVIRARGSGPSRTFTVRRVTHGEGVERVFPMDSPGIARVDVLKRGKVKRSRLYYLRRAIGKTRIAAAEGEGAGGTRPPAGDAAAAPQPPAGPGNRSSMALIPSRRPATSCTSSRRSSTLT